jgi:uroporphyrinogen decarboxylase
MSATVDEMTPKERLRAWREGGSLDRIPCGIDIEAKAFQLAGFGPKDFPLTPRQGVAAQKAAVDTYGQELVAAGFDLAGELAEALRKRLPSGADPDLPPLSDPSFIELIERMKPLESPGFRNGLATLELLLETYGETHQVRTYAIGPMTLASRLRGTDNLMRDTIVHPEFAHRLLNLATEITLDFLREIAKLDVTICIMDPVSSGSLIGPAAFREFSLPYIQRLTSELRALSSNLPNLHICGNIRPTMEAMAESGAGMIMNIDEMVDLEFVKARIGSKIAFSGNIRSVEAVLLGTPASVEENVKECMRKAWDSPRGFIISLDGFPHQAPEENIQALFSSIRRLGRWPYDREAWNPV